MVSSNAVMPAGKASATSPKSGRSMMACAAAMASRSPVFTSSTTLYVPSSNLPSKSFARAMTSFIEEALGKILCPRLLMLSTSVYAFFKSSSGVSES